MSPVVVIILVLVFAGIMMFVMGLNMLGQGQRESEQDRVERRLGIEKEDEEAVLASLLREQAQDSIRERLGAWGRETEDTLRQANSKMTLSQLVTTMAGVGFATAVVLVAVVGAKALPFALVAAYLPLAQVQSAASKRAKELLAQMPDSLEMMGRAMQTGAGLIDCFRLVSVEMKDPVAHEFGTIADEVKFGKDWRQALDGLVKRNPTLFDLRLLVSSLLLQRETGGNMIETLHKISKLIRQRAAFQNKVKAMTSEAKASGLVLALMPIGVLFLIMFANSSYLVPLVETGAGQIAILGSLGMYGTGLFLMNQMSKVSV